MPHPRGRTQGSKDTLIPSIARGRQRCLARWPSNDIHSIFNDIHS